MAGGFSFCGVDIAKYGLYYAPEDENTYVYGSGEYATHDETFDGHDGGYWYGTTLQPKEFVQRCFFENVTAEDLARIDALFSRGRQGRQVFERRPNLWYMARVVDYTRPQQIGVVNGILHVTLKAYYPFSQMDYSTLDEYLTGITNTATSEWGRIIDLEKQMKQTTAQMEADITPNVQYENIATQTTLLLANGGSEDAHVDIHIAGNVGDGVTIYNRENGSYCRVIGQTKAVTTDVNKYLSLNAMNGKTVQTNGTGGEMAFLYHDEGYLTLKGGYPIWRDTPVTWTQGTAQITSGDASFSPQMEGRHVRLNNEWVRIKTVTNEGSAVLERGPVSSGSENTTIVQLNEIVITPDDSMAQDRLDFVYRPTFK